MPAGHGRPQAPFAFYNAPGPFRAFAWGDWSATFSGAVSASISGDWQADVLHQPTDDPSVQPWAIKPPAAAAYNPANGFPWDANGADTPVVSQDVPEPDLTVAFATPGAVTWGGWSSTASNAVSADITPELPADVVAVPTLDDTVQAWAIQPPQAAGITRLTAFNGEPELWQQQPDTDPSVQAWAVRPPLNAAAQSAWTSDDSERFVADPFVPDITELVAGYVPPIAQAFNQPDEATFAPGQDDTPQAWAITPPQNAVQALAFNTPEDEPYATVDDPTVPTYAIQPPPYVPVFASTAWAVYADDEVQAQATPDESVQPWAIGAPQNATQALAWNVPDDTATGQLVADDTAQPWALGPTGFDPSAGFPWPAGDDIVQPTWWAADDTSQPWPITPPQSVPFVLNSSQPDVLAPAWQVHDDFSQTFIAAGSTQVFTGGRPPTGTGLVPRPGMAASGALPATRAIAARARGDANASRPSGSGNSPTSRGRA